MVKDFAELQAVGKENVETAMKSAETMSKGAQAFVAVTKRRRNSAAVIEPAKPPPGAELRSEIFPSMLLS